MAAFRERAVKKNPTMTGFAIALAAAAVTSLAPSHATQKLRFGVTIPERTSTVREAMAPWAREVSTASGGAVSIEMYTGGSLGRSGKLQYWLVKQSVLDIAWILPSDTPGLFPATDFFEIPLKSDDPLLISLAFWRLYQRGYVKGFEDVKPLALYVSPPYRMHLRFAYDGPESLSGRKIRAVTSLQSRLLEDAGATPIGGITTTQVAESLSRDLIDGALFSWHGVKAVGVMRSTSVHVDQPITLAPAMIVMNRKVYDGLTPEARAAIDAKSGEPLIRMLVQSMNKAAAEAVNEASTDPDRSFIESRTEDAEIWRGRFEKAARNWRSKSPDNERIAVAFDGILEEIVQEEADARE
ncbi:MAG TPA: hypothetical protein DDZ68_01765 [Parvularcula sp.]|nr:hypothetical protein [Parvularcula sp.]